MGGFSGQEDKFSGTRINFPVAGVFFSGQKDNFSDCRCLGGRVPEPLR